MSSYDDRLKLLEYKSIDSGLDHGVIAFCLEALQNKNRTLKTPDIPYFIIWSEIIFGWCDGAG